MKRDVFNTFTHLTNKPIIELSLRREKTERNHVVKHRGINKPIRSMSNNGLQILHLHCIASLHP